MTIDYTYLTSAVEAVATDMLIDAVSERRLEDADNLGTIIHTCRKIDRMLPITAEEEFNYIDFVEFNFYSGEKLTCKRK